METKNLPERISFTRFLALWIPDSYLNIFFPTSWRYSNSKVVSWDKNRDRDREKDTDRDRDRDIDRDIDRDRERDRDKEGIGTNREGIGT